MKMKRFTEAIKEFDIVITEVEKDIRPASLDKYGFKAYQKKAQMMHDML